MGRVSLRAISILPAAATAFTPLSLSNLRLWLDFSDTSTMNVGVPPVNNTPIVQITDKSPNAYSFLGGGVNIQPTFKTNQQNSLGWADFDSAHNDYLTCNIGTDATIVNIFWVGTSRTNTAYNSLCGSNVLDSTQMNWNLFSTNQLEIYANGDLGKTGNNTFPINTFQSAYYTYTSGAGVTGVNNVAKGSFATTGLRIEATNFVVGCNNAGFQSWDGGFGDFIVGTGSLWSATDLTNLYNWSKTKWAY